MRVIIDKAQLVKSMEYLALMNYKTDAVDDSAVLVSADSYTVALTGGNDENHTEIVLEAEVEEPGDIIVSANGLASQLKNFPSKEIVLTGNDEYVYFETPDDTEESMRCNIKVYAMESKKFVEYVPTTVTPILTITGSKLAAILSATSLGVDKKCPKEELRNLGLIIDVDTVTFVGFSSRRLVEMPIKTEPRKMKEPKRLSIPVSSVKPIAKMFKTAKNDVTVTIEKSNQGMRVRVSNNIMTCRLKMMNLDFPNYSSVIKAPVSRSMSFDSANLKRAINGLAGISKADSVVALSPQGNAMEFSLSSAESKTALRIPCTFKGEPKAVRLMGKDLKEAFSSITTATCTLNLLRDTLFSLSEDGGGYTFIGSLCTK